MINSSSPTHLATQQQTQGNNLTPVGQECQSGVVQVICPTCGMMVILARRVPKPSWEMSSPSMARDPEAASLILYIVWNETVDWVLLYKMVLL